MSTQKQLFRKFIPLSLSDAIMMLGDPLQTMTLSHLAGSGTQLAAVGIAKAFAVLLESPIIMVLHASTALGGRTSSRKALFQFVLLLSAVLTVIFAVFALVQPVYRWLLKEGFGATQEITDAAQFAFAILIIWPATIALRRYYQGILIRRGKSGWIARASLLRLLWVGSSLLFGYLLIQGCGWSISGAALASVSMAGGVVVEAALAAVAVRGIESEVDERPTVRAHEAGSEPTNLAAVARFYFPLATTMLLVWAARAILIGVVARAIDGPLALAAWPAAWGVVLLVANSTRMIQQIVISSADVPSHEFIKFSFFVGTGTSLLIAGFAFTQIGQVALSIFLGTKSDMILPCREVLRIATPFPFLVCFQNVFQGILIRRSSSKKVNLATLVSVVLALTLVFVLVAAGFPGAQAAASSMVSGVFIEVLLLYYLAKEYLI